MNERYKKLRMELGFQRHAFVASVSDLDSFNPIVIARLEIRTAVLLKTLALA